MLTLNVNKDYHSSSIDTIRYDENTSTLSVDFTSHSTYEYYKVPLEVFKKFEAIIRQAKETGKKESIGHLFHVLVKPNFKYKKIRG